MFDRPTVLLTEAELGGEHFFDALPPCHLEHYAASARRHTNREVDEGTTLTLEVDEPCDLAERLERSIELECVSVGKLPAAPILGDEALSERLPLPAFLGGEFGYLIGHKAGPRIFERKESGFFSIENVRRTNGFFERFGGLAVSVARFGPGVPTCAPCARWLGPLT